MAEYIDRAVCLSVLRAKANVAVLMDAAPYFEKAAQMLEKLPAADVAPVVHGCWIEYTKVIIPEPYNKWEQAWKCSECGFDDGFVAYNFCPNCGARMDLEESTDA